MTTFWEHAANYARARGGPGSLSGIEKKTLLEAQKQKAGILAYRIRNGKLQLLLVHPGGPYYVGTDAGYWQPPKGGIDPGESPLQCAKREFREETGRKPPPKLEFLGIPKGYRNCQIFVGEHDIPTTGMKSNTFELDGKHYPEIDKHKWFDVDGAAKYMDKRFHSLFANLNDHFRKIAGGEIISESAGNDLVKRLMSGDLESAYEVENALGGAPILGSGWFGTVYKVGNKAVKVGRDIDTCWLGFARYAMKKRSPWVPKIDFASELPKGGFAAVMETLSPVSGDFYAKIKEPEILLYVMLNFAYQKEPHYAKILNIFRKKFPKFNPAMQGTKVTDPKYNSHPFIKIIAAVDKLPGCRNDMHADNVMMRGAQIVIIDPVIRTKEFAAHIKTILAGVEKDRKDVARRFQAQQGTNR